MKIYEKQPVKVIRFDIKTLDETGKRCVKGKVITVTGTTKEQALKWLKNLFMNYEVTITFKASQKPDYTLITVYEALGDTKLKGSKSTSVYGLDAQQIYNIIMKAIENENKA